MFDWDSLKSCRVCNRKINVLEIACEQHENTLPKYQSDIEIIRKEVSDTLKTYLSTTKKRRQGIVRDVDNARKELHKAYSFYASRSTPKKHYLERTLSTIEAHKSQEIALQAVSYYNYEVLRILAKALGVRYINKGDLRCDYSPLGKCIYEFGIDAVKDICLMCKLSKKFKINALASK